MLKLGDSLQDLVWTPPSVQKIIPPLREQKNIFGENLGLQIPPWAVANFVSSAARKFSVEIPTSAIKNPHLSPPFFCSKIPTFRKIIPTFFQKSPRFKKKSPRFWNFNKNIYNILGKLTFFSKCQKLTLKFNPHSKKSDPHLTLKIPTVGTNPHFWQHWQFA